MQYSTSSENYSTSLRDSPSKWNGKDNKGYVYKKSSYQYSRAGDNSLSNDKSVDKNIDQLDALLEDLKNEREVTVTRDKDLLSSPMIIRNTERALADPGTSVTKTTRVIQTSTQPGICRNIDNVDGFSNSEYKTYQIKDYSTVPRPQAYEEYKTTNREIFESNKNLPTSSYENRNKINESIRVIESSETIPQKTTTTAANLSKDFQNIQLSEDILPTPGTKVTTTVRTYTYEVPADHQKNVSYSTIQQNEKHSTLRSDSQPIRNIPPTVVYNTESYSTYNKNSERPIVSNQTYEIRRSDHRETNTIRNDAPPHQHYVKPLGPTHETVKTTIYNTTENSHSGPDYNRFPPHSEPYESSPPGVTTNRYYYKESSNVVNSVDRPGIPIKPVHEVPSPTGPSKLPYTGYPPQDDGYPSYGSPNPSTVSYRYTSSTTNTLRGPQYGTPSPTLQPSPFPVDGVEYPITNGSPPQKVDDLMQSFRHPDAVDKSEASTIHRKKEIETAVASPNQQIIPTVNKAGKEVYYPPGHEMMLTKREEMAAGSAAGGRWAKGSGMYEYESGYKSKSKTKSGGAMVPVCLPLCCAMPCSIM